METATATEELLRLGKVAPLFGVTKGTILNWIKIGARLESGERVYLKAMKTPGLFRTTVADVERFLAAIQPRQGQREPAEQIETPAARRREADAAIKRLKAKGVKIQGAA